MKDIRIRHRGEVLEVVEFNPHDGDTYPSVCNTPSDVAQRFGFTGGELLAFTQRGAFVGPLDEETGELAYVFGELPAEQDTQAMTIALPAEATDEL